MRYATPSSRGFAAVAALFLVVILAALGGYMLNFSNAQQITSAQDVQGARAYWAARAGMSWGVASMLATPAATIAPNCPTGVPPSAAACPTGAPAAVNGFALAVSCTCAAYSDSGNVVRVFRFQSQASMGTAGSTGYIERSVSASVER